LCVVTSRLIGSVVDEPSSFSSSLFAGIQLGLLFNSTYGKIECNVVCPFSETEGEEGPPLTAGPVVLGGFPVRDRRF